jgi:tripeptidyl-peptidase-1
VYSLPASIASIVSHVEGVRRLPKITNAGLKQLPKNGKRIGLAVTPKLIRERYQTVGIASKNANNSQCVAQFIGQHYAQSDLDIFFTLFDRQNLGMKPIVRGNNGPPAGVEASLDIEYISSVGNKVKNTWFWVTPRADQTPFHDFFSFLANETNSPYVVSVSYGESEVGQTLSWLQSLDNEFMLSGLRGISILFASGDSGVSADGNCPNNQFEPDWPATSRYVTAVGGTELDFSRLVTRSFGLKEEEVFRPSSLNLLGKRIRWPIICPLTARVFLLRNILMRVAEPTPTCLLLPPDSWL